MNLIRINDETISSDSFVQLLKFSGRFDEIIDDIVREKLAVHEAKRMGVKVPTEAIQIRSDQLRRVNGLHRSVEMQRYLEALKATPDDYEHYVSDMLYYEAVMDKVVTKEAVEKYFRLNSPRFDSIDVSHIVVESEGKARELLAMLKDEPRRFAEFAHEHSIADTGEHGGHIGRVLRGALHGDVEAKVFHAKEGEVLGPFPAPDGTCYELFMVNSKKAGVLDEDTSTEIRRILREEWLAKQATEHRLEVL